MANGFKRLFAICHKPYADIMAVKTYKPITPSQRFRTGLTFEEITKTKPEKSLLEALGKDSGRSNGKITVRHKGTRQKRMYRVIDFKRNKFDVEAKVASIEYDPNRTANIALLYYKDGEKRYILAPDTLKVGDHVIASKKAEPKVGNAMSLKYIPVGSVIHNIELIPGKGGQIARSAGTYATLAAKEGDYAHVKMPSGEVRKVRVNNYATLGRVGNEDWINVVMGKAGRNRLRGIRPSVRGVAMNPNDHPHGGGEGKSGIGMPSPMSYSGKKTLGKKTRSRKARSTKFILSRRKK